MPLPVKLTGEIVNQVKAWPPVKLMGEIVNQVKAWPTRKKLIRGGVTLVVLTVLLRVSGILMLGLGEGKTVTTTEKRDSQGKITETTRTVTSQDAKTLWDLLSLFGVPITLVILGAVLQQQQQARADLQAKVERDRAEKQEALKTYRNQLSESDVKPDLIQTSTLSILRRFAEDGEVKGTVIQFLVAAKVINKANLGLSSANLSDANLSGNNLSGVNLSSCKLTRANLSSTDLRDTNFSFANLSDANLSDADLGGANLTGANLTGADLTRALLMEAKLIGAHLSGANLAEARLIDANLRASDLSNANLTSADLTNADLTNAKNWKEDQLAVAILCKTKLPEGCNLNPNRDAPSPERQQ